MAWTAGFDAECVAIVRKLVDGAHGEREAAWRALLERVGPAIERWAAANTLLRRCGLASEDDARAVLVGVLTRMKAKDHDTLRRFLATLRGAPEAHDPDDAGEASVVERFARVASLTRHAPADPEVVEDDAVGTPLRAWLIVTTRFAAKDHVKRRLGWTTTQRITFELDPPAKGPALGALRTLPGVRAVVANGDGLVVELAPGGGRIRAIEEELARLGHRARRRAQLDKRDVGTNADRLGPEHDESARPPMTDYLTMSQLLEEIEASMRSFPDAMQRAVRLWLDDASFDDIATQLALPAPEQARALVRAGQARLREQFRDRWQNVVRALGVVAVLLASTSARADAPPCPLAVADFEVVRGELHPGATCGSFVGETDAADDSFSYGAFRLRKKVRAPFELDVAIRRLTIETTSSIEIAVLGGQILMRDGQIALYTGEAAFELDGWHPLPGMRARDEHRVHVVQTGREVRVDIDGSRAGTWQLTTAPEEGALWIGHKGRRATRSRIRFRDLAITSR